MKRALAFAFAVAALGLAAGTASAASPVTGSISGPITAVSGKTFSVKTTLSPTGSSKVAVGPATTLTENVSGTRNVLLKGACVTASGTLKASRVAAARITVHAAVKGSCTGRFGGRFAGGRPRTGGGTGTRPPGGFNRPAGFGFAAGQVTAIKGATLTVKGFRGTQTISVSAKTAISKTETVPASSLRKGLCAFVFGTSSNRGVTVQADQVSLSKPVGGSCTFHRGGA